MKKLLSVVLVLTMCASLGACANSSQSATAANENGTHIVVDHGGNQVEVPNKIERIVVSDIFPIPAVLSVFFNSADKIVGVAPTSYSAAKNSLLSQIYPEILNAKTDFMNGNTINVEELMKLNPDVVFYSENNNEQKEVLTKAGFCAIGISANGWGYDCIETLNQ